MTQSIPQLPDWQPMATAPKDGTPVMLWSEARRGSWIGKWVDTYGSGFKPDNAWFSLMLNCHWHPNQYEALRPTHWKPLDAGPTLGTPTQGVDHG